MPYEEYIRVPVAQNCGGSNFRVNGVGVKIFENLAREPDCEHKIDSVVELDIAPSAQEFSIEPRGSDIERGIRAGPIERSRRNGRTGRFCTKFR
jgi:hypothetical protein